MSEKWHQLITLRNAAGLTQYELAHRLGISRSALGNYEMGEREPDFDTVSKLADFFGVSVDYLIGRQGPQDHLGTATVPIEWHRLFLLAQIEGFTPDQVLDAVRLLASVRQIVLQREERK